MEFSKRSSYWHRFDDVKSYSPLDHVIRDAEARQKKLPRPQIIANQSSFRVPPSYIPVSPCPPLDFIRYGSDIIGPGNVPVRKPQYSTTPHHESQSAILCDAWDRTCHVHNKPLPLIPRAVPNPLGADSFAGALPSDKDSASRKSRRCSCQMSSPKSSTGGIAYAEDVERERKGLAGEGSAPTLDPILNRALVRKQDLRIVPLSAGIYLLCYLDRSNIGNAKVLNEDSGNDLLDETGMTNYQYTIALMVFLIAYALFEVPSNYFLKKLRPSRWIAFLMLCWGACTIGLGGTKNFASVTVVRLLLGTFEAGLFPGLVYYLTFWYRTEERSIRVAAILASATLAGAFGGAIAYGVGHINGASGLSAWRWLFIIEGIPSCLSSILVFFFFPDYPETASWLSEDEKAFAKLRLDNEGSQGLSKSLSWAEAKSTLTDWRLYAHYLIYFGISAPFSSLSLFSPSITSGLGYTALRAQLFTVPPYAVAYAVTITTSWSADHFNSRALHSTVLSAIGALGFLASAVLPADAYIHRYGCLIVATSGAFACIPPLLGWLSSNMHTTGAAGLAIALNVSFGAPGQILGVWIYKANEKERGYPTGHWTNAGLLFFVAIGCLTLRLYYQKCNKRLSSVDGQRLFKY